MIQSQGSADRAQQDAAHKIFLEQFIPRVKQAPGYAGFVLAVDRDTGKAVSVTYWTDESSLKASAPSDDFKRSAEQAMQMRVTEIDSFELVMREVAQPPAAGTFIRTNDLAADPAMIETGIAFARDRVYPAVKGLPGFRSINLIVNRESGRTILNSVWTTLEDVERSEAAVVDLREEGVRATGARGVRVERWEVVAVELAAGVGSRP